jgi:hypothetical protein
VKIYCLGIIRIEPGKEVKRIEKYFRNKANRAAIAAEFAKDKNYETVVYELATED